MSIKKSTSWVVCFRLFGIPVSIHPVSWVVLALLGGALGVDDGAGLYKVAVFVAVGMLTLLVHEFGHALTGRAAGALVSGIEIAGMGGATHFAMLPPGRFAYSMVVAAGPLASLLLGGVLGVCFGWQLGSVWSGVQYAYLMPWMDVLPMSLQHELVMGLTRNECSLMMIDVYTTGMLVCFWWSIFNLLPILPLDGGKLLAVVLKNYLIPSVLGVLICCGLAVWALVAGSWFNVMILGYLAFINWQYLCAVRSRR